MPITHARYLQQTTVSGAAVAHQKMQIVVRRAQQAAQRGAGLTEDVLAAMVDVERMLSVVADWISWRDANPPPDPATASEDWEEPRETLDFSRSLVAVAQPMIERLTERIEAWTRLNESMAEFRVRKKDQEDRRHEHGILNRMGLNMDMWDAAQTALRELETHEERMDYLRDLQDQLDATTQPPPPPPEPSPESILSMVDAKRRH